MKNNIILIASAINKPPQILSEFLNSLKLLENSNYHIAYCFIDDNKDKESSKLLFNFNQHKNNSKILNIKDENIYADWEKGDHNWSINKIDKITKYKNYIIKYFLENEYSYLFFVDADLVLHPKTLVNLLTADKDIISNIFWTKWQENSMALPQVWLKDFYTLYDDHMLVKKSNQEIQNETNQFILMLTVPGVYKVGGLGACTLIKRKVFEDGVNFSPLYNISFWGEDRSFCIRAVAHDYELYVDTHNPAFHIFRIEELNELTHWKLKNNIIDD